jgi:hypothetical protein
MIRRHLQRRAGKEKEERIHLSNRSFYPWENHLLIAWWMTYVTGKALGAQSAPILTPITITHHHHLRLAEPRAYQTQSQQFLGQLPRLAANVVSMQREITQLATMTMVMMVVVKGNVGAMA